ncbi:MAG: phosphoenolpyruvate carboxykinase (ATP) [Candidatus Poseidoniia archaeon]|jgi:phosphoenolpyruvate carboxykinase (ATP)|nr:phosphoenolpyruvate carboxykinase (ATP) [Candidatus Poseidoniia archaeon]MDP7607482.1 phosphoenolpyruvate carboxykinase (ATP) [Candidatus Poseidoniia archaeon]HJP43817.1 phosphoenolpyruvate carboxykinase (ATP) [Candidatus Poseidoniia archaeon]
MDFAGELGLSPKLVHRNLSQQDYRDMELHRGEGVATESGTVAVSTGIYTGRSPQDRFFVRQPPSEAHIDWGAVNQPLAPEAFERLHTLVRETMAGEELFVFDGHAGADERYRLPLRVVTLRAWQAHFAHNMFIRPSREELHDFEPQFTVLNAISARAEDWQELGLNSEIFIAVNLEQQLIVIGGTEYGGEIKKGIFTVLNYLLPLEGVMPMHCSANVGGDGDTALFFGLSGTGKTTLSTDPARRLIGDDEHGWSDDGIFNFEGGCYAKTIGLERAREPEIYDAIRPGALLENVVVRDDGSVDYADGSITENTRVSYPLEHIANSEPSGHGGHPRNVIFLTCDAFGVLPPVAKLTPEMAMYHFLSGYTAKVAGTERGVTEPIGTFSTCFGAPFMPQHPAAYAKLLGEKLERHSAQAWLVNTGWTGGPYGSGQRIALADTRRMLAAILSDELGEAEFRPHPVFRVLVPQAVPDVDSGLLDPRATWADVDAYDAKARELAQLFNANFAQYGDHAGLESAFPKTDI